ncbi:hypothetical protein [Botrimarina mediterranea]|uniref:hypothetical protein n=1 Tax=Botrimarina mediterranea TaxID=2528022 RepID=UPI00118B73DB|nr:hypothetical protein K2D_18300 [Planctomycetes bacterium K2D]
MYRIRLVCLTLRVALALVVLAPVAALAERPTSMRLFPGRSVFFVRTPDATELSDRFNSGGGGELLNDPEISPFLKALFNRIDESYREGPGKATGGGLADMLALFEGEVALGIVPRRNEPPGVVFLADTVSGANRKAGEPMALADGQERATKLLDSIKEYASGRGEQIASEPVGSATATVIRRGDNANETFGAVERDGVLIICNDRILLESVVTKWDEAEGLVAAVEAEAEDEEEKPAEDEDRAKRAKRLRQRYAEPLSDNEAFTESLRECVSERLGAGDESPPQLVAFIDPVGIFRAVAQENAGARIALATLPILGIDGVEGAAGSVWINEGEWDSLFRAHLLLDNPRAGVLKMARLLPCDPTPVDAIPSEVAAYTCGAVDFAGTLDGASQLYDRIRGEGRFAEDAEKRFAERAGVTPTKLIEHFTGKFVSLQAYGETPEGAAPRVTPARAIFLETHEPEKALTVVEAVLNKVGANLEQRDHNGHPYFVLPFFEEMAQKQREEGPRPGQAPMVISCLALIGDDVVFCETYELMQKLLDTHAGEGDRLAEHLPFRLMANRINRLGAATVGGEEGRILMYQDPVAQFRQWHAAGSSDASREQLNQMAEFAPPMRWLRDALEDSGVPSAEAMMKYATPSGAAIYDTPRGFRYVAFSFKRAKE